MNLNEMITIDLPSLEFMTFCSGALEGRKGESCSLTLRSNIDITKSDKM